MSELLIFIFSPAFIFMVYDVIFYYIPLYNNSYPNITGQYLYGMILLDVSACFLLLIPLLGSSLLSKKKCASILPKKSKTLSKNHYRLFLLIAITLFFFLVHSVFESYNLADVFAHYPKFYALTKRGTAWVFIIFNIIFFSQIYDFYLNGVQINKFFYFVGVFLVASLTGGRSFFIIVLLFITFIHVVLNKTKLLLRHFIIIILLCSIVFIGNALMRANGLNNYFNKSSTLDFNAAFILNDVINYLEHNDTPYFNCLDDLFYMVIPRHYYPDKPLSTAETRLVYPEIADRGTNLTLGIYGNAFINVGYYWGFIATFLYLIFSNILWFYLIKNDRIVERNSLKFLLLFLLFNSLLFIRGGVFNSRVVIIIISIMIAQTLHKLISKNNEELLNGSFQNIRK